MTDTLHPRWMTDAEFDAARRARVWRDPIKSPPQPTPAETSQRRTAVRAMTNAEFNAAIARKDWRNQK